MWRGAEGGEEGEGDTKAEDSNAQMAGEGAEEERGQTLLRDVHRNEQERCVHRGGEEADGDGADDDGEDDAAQRHRQSAHNPTPAAASTQREKEKTDREKQNGCSHDGLYHRAHANMQRCECDEQLDAEQGRSEQMEEAAGWEEKEGGKRREEEASLQKKKKERQLREEKKEQQAMVTDEQTQRTRGDCGLFSEGWRDTLEKEREQHTVDERRHGGSQTEGRANSAGESDASVWDTPRCACPHRRISSHVRWQHPNRRRIIQRNTSRRKKKNLKKKKKKKKQSVHLANMKKMEKNTEDRQVERQRKKKRKIRR